MWKFWASDEDKQFIHDVFLMFPGTQLNYPFQQIEMASSEYYPIRTQMCVAQGHATWAGLCKLLIEAFAIDANLVRETYLSAWVNIKTMCWDEDKGSFYKIEHRIINEATPSAVMASYIFNPNIDFLFKVTKKGQSDIFNMSPFMIPDRLRLPDEDYTAYPTPTRSIADPTRTKSPVLV